MRSLGIRAIEGGFHWALVGDGQGKPDLLEHDQAHAPEIGTEATGLTFLRERVIALLLRLKPDVCVIRYPEPVRPKSKSPISSDARTRVEGVLLEAISAHGVRVETATHANLARMLGSKRPKAYLDKSRDEIRGIPYPNKNASTRDAIMVALAGIEEE